LNIFQCKADWFQGTCMVDKSIWYEGHMS
jgi:hypothetical protein